MTTLWHTSSSVGRERYGSAYTDIYDISNKHATLAGDQECDHMHDGLGFMTQHMGLTLEFEQAMQAVDASVSLPYWDFTLDMYERSHGNWTDLVESPMWRETWFGSHDEDGEHANTITKGRWAFIEIESKAWKKTHNSYGYMRAPWNNNNRPYLTRSHHMCGFKFEAMPKCSDHYEVRARARSRPSSDTAERLMLVSPSLHAPFPRSAGAVGEQPLVHVCVGAAVRAARPGAHVCRRRNRVQRYVQRRA